MSLPESIFRIGTLELNVNPQARVLTNAGEEVPTLPADRPGVRDSEKCHEALPLPLRIPIVAPHLYPGSASPQTDQKMYTLQGVSVPGSFCPLVMAHPVLIRLRRAVRTARAPAEGRTSRNSRS